MNIPLNCKRWPRNEETATTPNTPMFVFKKCGSGLALISNTPLNYRSQRAALCRQRGQREQNAFLQITSVQETSQSCCRYLLATAFQDEPKCHCSLSRNSNYGVSLLLLWQVLKLLVNIEKQQHRWLQCSAFLGLLLKTQTSTTLWKKFVPFFWISHFMH